MKLVYWMWICYEGSGMKGADVEVDGVDVEYDLSIEISLTN